MDRTIFPIVQRAPILRLPQDCLVRCIELAVRGLPTQRYGGSVSDWWSNEEIAPLALVSKAFYFATFPVLWRSVALFTENQLNAFSQVFTQSDIAQKVRFLALGAEDSGEESEDSDTLVHGMCEAVRACPNLQEVHFIAIEAGMLEKLSDALAGKQYLKTVVCSPCIMKRGDGTWAERFFCASTGIANIPSLRFLEIEAQGCGPHGPTIVDEPRCSPCPAPLALSKLKIHFDMFPSLLHSVISNCSSLNSLDVYIEHPHPRLSLGLAIAKQSKSLTAVRWISNVDERTVDSSISALFDETLLPSLTSLEVLCVSTLEIPRRVLRIVPPSLQALEIVVLREIGILPFLDDLLEGLSDRRVAKGLKSLVIHDDSDLWDEELVETFETACTARHVKFQLIEDLRVSSRFFSFPCWENY